VALGAVAVLDLVLVLGLGLLAGASQLDDDLVGLVLLAIVVLPHDLKGLALQGKLLLGGNHAHLDE
jgi:hypothetical protein